MVKVLVRGFDHDRHAAGVDLVAGQVGKILHDRAMHETRAAGPLVFGLRFRQHGHVFDAVLALPLFGKLVQIEIGAPASAPVERHRPRAPFVQGVLDDRLDGRETGSAREEDDGLRGFLAQEESAQRPFEAQDLLLLHLVEDVIAEGPAVVAQVQLEQRVVLAADSPSRGCAACRLA